MIALLVAEPSLLGSGVGRQNSAYRFDRYYLIYFVLLDRKEGKNSRNRAKNSPLNLHGEAFGAFGSLSFGIAESLRAAFLAFHYPSYPLPWFLHELRIVLLNSINGVA